MLRSATQFPAETPDALPLLLKMFMWRDMQEASQATDEALENEVEDLVDALESGHAVASSTLRAMGLLSDPCFRDRMKQVLDSAP